VLGRMRAQTKSSLVTMKSMHSSQQRANPDQRWPIMFTFLHQVVHGERTMTGNGKMYSPCS
jgi:hypothetical protein